MLYTEQLACVHSLPSEAVDACNCSSSSEAAMRKASYMEGLYTLQ
jgi:hypothetical protein